MLDLKIVNGILVVPEQGEVRAGLGILDGRIVMITDDTYLPEAVRTVDAGGRPIAPGLIDPHVHLGSRSPYAEECVSETRSALLGGMTTLGVYIRRLDSYLPHVDGLIKIAKERAFTDVFFHLQLFNLEQIREIHACAERFGVSSFKIYMNGIPGRFPHLEDGPLLEAFREIARLGPSAMACVHAEVASMVEEAHRRVAHAKVEGSLADWSDTHPPEAEELAVIRAAYLASVGGASLYIVHLTSQEAVRRLRELRARQARLYVEVTSPSLSLTKFDPSGLMAKRHPPLRGPEDVEALWAGLRDGVIDTVATDNVTNNRAGSLLERGWLEAKGGFPMLGTHLPVLLHEGHHARRLSLRTLTEKACLNPARLFGLYPAKGTIAHGSDADLVILDVDREEMVDVGRLQSFGDLSPYEGRRLRGWPWMVIKGGAVAVENGKLTAPQGTGRYLRREPSAP
jgi:dihydropyrimidinase